MGKKFFASLLAVIILLMPISTLANENSTNSSTEEESLHIQLFHQRNYDEEAEYIITAEIVNKTDSVAQNVVARLDFDNVFLKAGDSFVRTVGDMQPQEQKTLSWAVLIKDNNTDVVDYGITVTVDNEVKIQQENKINLGKTVELSFLYEDNEMTNKATYSDSYFKENTGYNHELAWLTLCLELSSWTADVSKWSSGKAYNSSEVMPNNDELSELRYKYIKDAYSAIGFDETYFYNYDVSLNDASDKVAFSVATKKDVCGATLVAVVIRGGVYGGEWKSNFNVGNGEEYHEGFYNAAKAVYDKVVEHPDYSEVNGNIKLWVTGYSRGGAVANLLSSMLFDEAEKSEKFDASDIFSYTFAAPQGLTNKKNVTDDLYKNIYNIVNPGDIVPLVAPSGWGFSLYGTTKRFNPASEISGKTNDNCYLTVNDNYSKIRKGNFNVKSNLEQEELNKALLNAVTRAFPDADKSQKFQKVLGDFLEFVNMENDEGESISTFEYFRTVLGPRYGNKYIIAYSAAKIIVSIIEETQNVEVWDLDYVAVMLTLSEIHGISAMEMYELLKSVIANIETWQELYKAEASEEKFISIIEGHRPEVYLAWMNQNEYQTFGGVKTINKSVSQMASSNEVIVCDHPYAEWKIIKEPTEEEKGIKEKTCACGYSLTEEISEKPAESDDPLKIALIVGSSAILVIGIVITIIAIKRRKKNLQ